MVPTSNNEDDDPEMQAMMHYMLKRRRRFWILMAFAAGIPLVVGGAYVSFLIRPSPVFQWIVGTLPLLAWETHCANNILKTIPGLSFNARMLWLVPLLVVLVALNIAIVFGIFWAGCFIIMGGRMHF